MNFNLDNLIRFTFSDGQPHIKMSVVDILDGPYKSGTVDIQTRVRNPTDLFELGQVCEVLDYNDIRYNIRLAYLSDRMDKRNSDYEPYTLKVWAKFLNSLNHDKISVFCPHSKTTSDLLEYYDENYFKHLEENFYAESIADANRKYVDRLGEPTIVFPDAGAAKRYKDSRFVQQWSTFGILEKDRDIKTGHINGMFLVSGDIRRHCIIVDDLCDGGKTFIEAAKVLRLQGAERVTLVVAHGIFSKGLCLEGIDMIYTTDSFQGFGSTNPDLLSVTKVFKQ